MDFKEKVIAFVAAAKQKDKMFIRKTLVQSTRLIESDGLPALTLVPNETLGVFIDSGHWQVIGVPSEHLPAAVENILNEARSVGRPPKDK